ncbi:MAG: GOLPH3/VPS74 family protein [Desulfitobacteriaceae bacterium]
MVLSLPEELLLLALNEEKGTFSWVASSKLPYVLAGSLLMELILRKRLAVEPKRLEVLDRTPTGLPLLDEILKSIDSSKKVRPADVWVGKIGRRIKPMKVELLEELVDKGILHSEEHLVFGIFPTTRYPLRDDRPKKTIISNVRSLILRREAPDPRQMMLIALVYTIGLTHVLFDKEERRDARKRVGEIAKPLPITQAINKAIQRASTHSS